MTLHAGFGEFRLTRPGRGIGTDQVSTPWFESAQLEAYLAQSAFDPETERFIRDFARDGMALVDLGDEARGLCDQAVAETDGYFLKGASRVQDAWYRSPAVRRLATWPRMSQLLYEAYGREPFAFQTLNFRQGTQQPIHSDAIHFHSEPERFMCGVWIALEDVSADAGPLVYYPGSHRLPVMTMRGAGVNTDQPGYDDYESTYVPRYAESLERAGLSRREALVKKGWAFVWAANLAHGGAPIQTAGTTRRSIVAHHYFADCLYYTPMYSDVEAGRLRLRLPPDVRTGRWRWPTKNGRRARLPAKLVVAAWLRDVLRRPTPM